MTIHAFIDIAPTKFIPVCNNCKHFDLWGVATGYCKLKKREKTQNQTCKDIDLK